MNPQGSDLLAQLRDIHAAAEAPWWPPAPGWWLLALILLVILGGAMRRGVIHWRRQRRQRIMTGWVEAIEQQVDPATAPQAFLASINRVFKLVALRAFPDHPCARLQGEEWVSFLRASMDETADRGHLVALSSGPYQPAPEFDPAAMTRLARRWIKQYG